MALYIFTCTECNYEFGILRTPKQIQDIKLMPCKECGKASKRTPKGATSPTVKEGIDTGFMPRKLERLAEADRLFKDRNAVAKKKEEDE